MRTCAEAEHSERLEIGAFSYPSTAQIAETGRPEGRRIF